MNRRVHRALRPFMTMRARLLIFIATLLAVSVWSPPTPWPVVIGCAVYLVVVFPAIGRR